MRCKVSEWLLGSLRTGCNQQHDLRYPQPNCQDKLHQCTDGSSQFTLTSSNGKIPPGGAQRG